MIKIKLFLSIEIFCLKTEYIDCFSAVYIIHAHTCKHIKFAWT